MTRKRFTVIECTDFALFGRYLTEGETVVREVLRERADLGFNMLRVWSEYQGNAQFTAEIGRLVPAEHPRYAEQLVAFFALCSAYGLYVELTAFTGTGIPGHWEWIGWAAPQATNVIVELTNENNAHTPNINPANYRSLAGIPCAHGSNGSQSVPVRPWWQYETFHTNDAPEFQRKVGHNAMEISEGADALQGSHIPVIANENTRPDRDGNLTHFYDAAAGAALLCAGSCFHSQSGKRSALFTAADRPFAEAWVAGARSVNLDYQEGRYVHESAMETPADLRVYSRVNPDGSRETVRIRK